MITDSVVIQTPNLDSIVVTDNTGSITNVVPSEQTTDTVLVTASQGPQGPQGVKGDKGDKGDTGSIGPIGTDMHYVHTQAIPSDTWIITHNLNKRPSVAVVDSSGSLVEGEVEYTNGLGLVVYFSAGFSGTAYLN